MQIELIANNQFMDNTNRGDSVSIGNQFAGFVGKLAISNTIDL